MSTDPMGNLDPMRNRRECGAKKRDGNPCRAQPLAGQTRCRLHGGGSPQARRKAQMRLMDLVDPAITRLATELNNRKAAPRDRLLAATAILDRAGFAKGGSADADIARELLLERIAEARATNLILEALPNVVVEDIRDAEVVDDDDNMPNDPEDS